MAAITDLTTLAAADVASGDYLVIHDVSAATDKKITKQAFDYKTQATGSGSIANGATVNLGASIFGVILVMDATSGAQGFVWCVGGSNTTAVMSQRTASGISIAAVKNTASAVNVYYETSAYYIQNNTGSTSQVYYAVIAA